MQCPSAMANQLDSDELRTYVLRKPAPARLRGDVIHSDEQRRCTAIDPEAFAPASKKSSIHASRILAQCCKVRAMKLFESDGAIQAKIDGRYDKVIVGKLEDHPEGYPRLAAFIDSDIDYVMFRRFGILHARSLLYKQAELTELEEELQKLDKEDENSSTDWRLHSHINLSRGDNKLRKELMEKLIIKLKEYDELLLRDHQIRNLRKPSRRLHESLLNYIYNEHPVTQKDEKFIYHRDDFVCLTDHVEYNWLDDIIHKFMDYDQSGLLRRICTTKEDLNRTTDPAIRYYSRSRLGVFMSTLIASLSTTLLLFPVYILITVPLNMRMMATVVLGCVFLFAAALSIFTDARRLDVFMATATYSAVLVVFLGNLQQGVMILEND